MANEAANFRALTSFTSTADNFNNIDPQTMLKWYGLKELNKPEALILSICPDLDPHGSCDGVHKKSYKQPVLQPGEIMILPVPHPV